MLMRMRSRLHYIPLSMDYNELYNIFAYFSGPTGSMTKGVTSKPDMRIVGGDYYTSSGDHQLRKIALAGRKWKRTIARKIDMDSGFFRPFQLITTC